MAEDNLQPQPKPEVVYDESKIRHLEDTEHIRTRPGMYIGRLGDGSHAEDGIYVLLKESIDNSIDEFNEGYGKRIEVNIHDNLSAEIRDYGRGIPLGALVDAVSKLNTGGKYDTAVFTASVGMNGVGLKAVNALSVRFVARSVRDGKMREATFEKGVLISDTESTTDEENGTYIFFQPDKQLFVNYRFHSEFVENLLRNYTYLNTGLAIFYNGRRIISRNGLEDLLNDNMTAPGLYPIIHLTGPNIDIAFTHTSQFNYSQMTERQIDQYVNMYVPVLDLRMVSIVENEQNEIVAVGISMASLSEALQKAKGKLLPFGWFHLLKALKWKRPKMLDLLLVAVRPDYQGKGVNALLFTDLIPVYQELGFEYAETNPELEMNDKVQNQWQYFKTEQHKRRRCFKGSL
uniref:DNA topoisomerase (ATP-hydrolyzing) n=1 Tax=uncultured prokaryote TaxID=198431 RepID=A0A0H5QR21_9ZZZZ|nr:hypothetical protein [uncultured prokaryote]